MGIAAILVMWALIFVINLLLPTYGVSIWNLSSIGLVFSENIVLKYCWNSNMRDLGWKIIGLELIYSHCHIMLIISRENNVCGFKSFQKINFSKNKSV